MSATESLTHFYKSLFLGMERFAIAPYPAFFIGYTGRNFNGFFSSSTYFKNHESLNPPYDREEDDIDGIQAFFATCLSGVLTVIPILPALTILTMSLSLVGAVLATASTLLAYPIAAIIDCAADSGQNSPSL